MITEFRPSKFQILPTVIKNLLIINVLVFLAQITFDGVIPNSDLTVRTGKIMDLFALHHVMSPLFRPWQLLTHMFMHGSFLHIFSNMFALWMFGSILENLWGTRRFLIFYLVCGVGAALIHLGFLWIENHQLLADFTHFKDSSTVANYFDFYKKYRLSALDIQNENGFSQQAFQLLKAWTDDPYNSFYISKGVEIVSEYTNYSLSEPTLGASGAVFGCLVAFGYLFPNTYVYFYFFIPLKAKWFVLLYIAFELSMAVRFTAGSGDGVAHWAHLGGAVVGFLLVFLWNKTKRRRFY